ncbi:magnesium transporter [Saccharopolyspora spinosporotrichia]|uniref:CBS domain containing protein n=1 Tax=Saccharopolyspora erythraea (strain ATCC 11635 / DSM 40517 / JCM 4748 / NBRC 13426 / NCIMB 8594 / NRRL 2338) TaxID=405948 RepID=A4FCH3_SACEN|nr:CBS domain containing protein [Saccharopolyspora erythraea NRRL 2338]
MGTAYQHASTNVPRADAGDSVDQALARLRGKVFDSASVLVVCRGERLTGLITIERALAAAPGTPVVTVMDTDPPVVAPGTDQERAAWEAVHHRESGLAVVDDDGRFRGLIPPERMLAVLLDAHDRDMARLGGFLASAASARTASVEGVLRRLWHRLPWLLVGLAGALVAAVIVGSFESQLQQQVLIAFFVPGVVYIADAVGTQTETLVIRGLSVGVGIARVAMREVLTGVLLGLLLAVLALPVVALLWRDLDVAFAVAVALVLASSIATVIAMALPWAFHRLGKDPAFGSGPLATVVQDLLSVLIYFVVATALVT